MDFNTILPILSELLSQKTSNVPEQNMPQQEQYSPSAPPNPNDSYWQLPSYSYADPNSYQKNHSNYKKTIKSCPNGQCGQYRKQNTYTNTNFQNNQNNGQYEQNGYSQNGYSENYGQNGYSQQESSKPPLDIGTIIQLLTQLAPLFPKRNTATVAEEEKEVFPSYISNLPRTDRWTFD